LQTVIVVPAVLLAITMVFQSMEYYWAREAAETAARQAVDAARVIGGDNGDGTTQADSVLNQLGSPLEGVTVKVILQGGAVVATITGHPHDLIPGLNLTVSVTAEGPVEQFSPPP
jgi:hypothetical protein